MINKIITITTLGCQACKINEKLLLDAIDESKIKLTLEIVDCCNIDYKDFIKENNVTDFPTTFFIKDNEIKFSYIGTLTKEGIKYRIKCSFYP